MKGLKRFKQTINYDDIDSKMRGLCRTINLHPHFATISCCEGHPATLLVKLNSIVNFSDGHRPENAYLCLRLDKATKSDYDLLRFLGAWGRKGRPRIPYAIEVHLATGGATIRADWGYHHRTIEEKKWVNSDFRKQLLKEFTVHNKRSRVTSRLSSS